MLTYINFTVYSSHEKALLLIYITGVVHEHGQYRRRDLQR